MGYSRNHGHWISLGEKDKERASQDIKEVIETIRPLYQELLILKREIDKLNISSGDNIVSVAHKVRVTFEELNRKIKTVVEQDLHDAGKNLKQIEALGRRLSHKHQIYIYSSYGRRLKIFNLDHGDEVIIGRDNIPGQLIRVSRSHLKITESDDSGFYFECEVVGGNPTFIGLHDEIPKYLKNQVITSHQSKKFNLVKGKLYSVFVKVPDKGYDSTDFPPVFLIQIV